MDRREFLLLTGTGAAAAALAAWLGGCRSHTVGSGDPSAGGPLDPDESGPPLLALLVPKDQGAGYDRGRLVGGLLNHGGDEVLADLARVELVCVVPERLPQEVRPESEQDLPLFLLLTREQGRVSSREFRTDVVADAGHGFASGEEWKKIEAEAMDRVRRVAAEVHAFLQPSVGPADDTLADRARQARARYVERPPPGAAWARQGGCGTTVEGAPGASPMVACGMGMVPEASQRFLHFYVKA